MEQTRANLDAIEGRLRAADINFEKFGADWYDNSIELYGVLPNDRLSEEAQRIVHESGISIAYVNHTDKWETHYSFDPEKEFKLSDGWRVRYGHKCDPEVDFIQVENSFPNGWPKDWLKSGYVRVVAGD